jgi:hypothetical protein
MGLKPRMPPYRIKKSSKKEGVLRKATEADMLHAVTIVARRSGVMALRWRISALVNLIDSRCHGYKRGMIGAGFLSEF